MTITPASLKEDLALWVSRAGARSFAKCLGRQMSNEDWLGPARTDATEEKNRRIVSRREDLVAKGCAV